MDALLVHTSSADDVECAIRLGWDGAVIRHAKSPLEALRQVADRTPVLIAIDKSDDFCPLELTRQLREVTDSVVVITTRDYDEYQLAAAVDAGADDYLPVPVNPAIFVPRIRAAARRAGHVSDARISLGKLAVDSSRHQVQVAGHDIHLAASEFKVLVELVRLEGRVATRDVLASAIWGDEHASYRAWLRKYIQSLRRRVCDAPGSDIDIVTVPRVGYKLVVSQAAA
jgi:DNA-binding response OmpR family regulator